MYESRSKELTVEWETIQINFKFWIYVEETFGGFTFKVPKQMSKTLIFYVADTKEKKIEGFKFKECIDFKGVNAVGMIFPFLYRFPYEYIEGATFTMENVKFPLVLVVVDLYWDLKEKTIWKQNESSYEVLSISGNVVSHQIIYPGEKQINVSFKNLSHPVVLEMDPEVFKEIRGIYETRGMEINISPRYASLLGIPP
jgi:uncharacterized membrane protein (UPF0127 family)